MTDVHVCVSNEQQSCSEELTCSLYRMAIEVDL